MHTWVTTSPHCSLFCLSSDVLKAVAAVVNYGPEEHPFQIRQRHSCSLTAQFSSLVEIRRKDQHNYSGVVSNAREGCTTMKCRICPDRYKPLLYLFFSRNWNGSLIPHNNLLHCHSLSLIDIELLKTFLSIIVCVNKPWTDLRCMPYFCCCALVVLVK